MLTVERELALAVYLLYSIDCVHWLKPGEMALTRRWSDPWKPHLCEDESYTLLGRMPVFVNPVDLRPSFISGTPSDLRPIQATIPDVVARYVPDAWIVTLLSSLGAANLLVFIPVLLVTGYLGEWWRLTLAFALLIHLCLAFEIYEQGAPWRVASRSDFWQQFISLTLNPLAALRSGDVLLRGLAARIINNSPDEFPASTPKIKSRNEKS